MEEWEIYPRVATAVALKAIEQGLARKVMTRDEIYSMSLEIIKATMEKYKLLYKNGYIKEIPKEVNV
jgi:malate dehydrogenase (oxaloacetate-decarboxylating)